MEPLLHIQTPFEPRSSYTSKPRLMCQTPFEPVLHIQRRGDRPKAVRLWPITHGAHCTGASPSWRTPSYRSSVAVIGQTPCVEPLLQIQRGGDRPNPVRDGALVLGPALLGAHLVTEIVVGGGGVGLVGTRMMEYGQNSDAAHQNGSMFLDHVRKGHRNILYYLRQTRLENLVNGVPPIRQTGLAAHVVRVVDRVILRLLGRTGVATGRRARKRVDVVK